MHGPSSKEVEQKKIQNFLQPTLVKSGHEMSIPPDANQT